MKNEFLNSKKTKFLSKQEQKTIKGGFFGGSSECTATGCVPYHHASDYEPGETGFIGFEGGPCALETPNAESCIGITRNGLCCIG